MEFTGAAMAFHAAAYAVGAVLGFYVLLTPLKFSGKTLPRVEGAAWLLALFLFSQAAWSFGRAAIYFLGGGQPFPAVPEIFWLVGQGAMTLFLLRLTSADPAHGRFGTLLVLFMIAGLNALLIKYVLEASGANPQLFLFAVAGFVLAQITLSLIQLLRASNPDARALWASILVGLAAEFLQVAGIGNSEMLGVAATITLGIALPLQLVKLEKGGWPDAWKFAGEEELRIAGAAFMIMIYLLLFSVYFYSLESFLPRAQKTYNNVLFFVSACWIYLLFAALVWYAAYRQRSEKEDARWREMNANLEAEVRRRTGQLASKLRQLERFERVATGREMRIAELRGQIKKLGEGKA